MPTPHTNPAELESTVTDIYHVPRLIIASRRNRRTPYDATIEQRLKYYNRTHKDFPHVVKFSGGRSSGMLLFTLLENGILSAERGDVVLFNNTSAEHPETYRFVATCKKLVEERYKIPFFWLEFQTYEDARSGEWTRLPSYRLAHPRPKSETEQNGFHWRGEVFEELLSWSGFVPNKFQRICTDHMKLQTSRAFLRDWFAGKCEIEHLGHHGTTSRLDDDVMHIRHMANRGGVPRAIYLNKKEFMKRCPVSRPTQRFADYSTECVPFNNQKLENHSFGDVVELGPNGVEYLSFVGLRNDEMHRVMKVKARGASGPESTGYEGEHVYMPLADIGVEKRHVNEFWDAQEWDLELDNDGKLSNCVYCFLKGAGNLRKVHQRMETAEDVVPGFGSLKGTPSDVEWWQRMEEQYGRDLTAENREVRAGYEDRRIGFFGANTKFSYQLLTQEADESADMSEYLDTILPCDCTD